MSRTRVPPEVRRRLRMALGTRTQRRAGTKSAPATHPLPKARLHQAIAEWRHNSGETGDWHARGSG